LGLGFWRSANCREALGRILEVAADMGVADRADPLEPAGSLVGPSLISVIFQAHHHLPITGLEF
jgi:hypothetical protein